MSTAIATVAVCTVHRLVLQDTEASFLKHCPDGHSVSKREGWSTVPADQVRDGKARPLPVPTHTKKKAPTPLAAVKPMAARKPVLPPLTPAEALELQQVLDAPPVPPPTAPTERIEGARIGTCRGCGLPFSQPVANGRPRSYCDNCGPRRKARNKAASRAAAPKERAAVPHSAVAPAVAAKVVLLPSRQNAAHLARAISSLVEMFGSTDQVEASFGHLEQALAALLPFRWIA
jgi:hypothetical protein